MVYFIYLCFKAYTQFGGLRPFGVSFLFTGWDEHHGFQLYHSDPSGNYGGWKATAIGANNQVGGNHNKIGTKLVTWLMGFWSFAQDLLSFGSDHRRRKTTNKQKTLNDCIILGIIIIYFILFPTGTSYFILLILLILLWYVTNGDMSPHMFGSIVVCLTIRGDKKTKITKWPPLFSLGLTVFAYDSIPNNHAHTTNH